MYRGRRIRKALGGSMRQAGIIAAAGVYALDNCVQRLAEDHKNAKKIGYGMIVYTRQKLPHVDNKYLRS